MVLYLVSNNLVIDDIVYETDETLEEKRINRPLSIEGEKMAVKLVKKIKANIVVANSNIPGNASDVTILLFIFLLFPITLLLLWN